MAVGVGEAERQLAIAVVNGGQGTAPALHWAHDQTMQSKRVLGRRSLRTVTRQRMPIKTRHFAAIPRENKQGVLGRIFSAFRACIAPHAGHALPSHALGPHLSIAATHSVRP